MKKHLGLVAALALWLTPLVPSGCAVEDVRKDPDYSRGVALLDQVRSGLADGLSPGEADSLLRKLSEFDALAIRLQTKLEAQADETKSVADGVKNGAAPLIPPPFNMLLDPAAFAAVALWLRRQHKDAFAKLLAQSADLKDKLAQ